jgi:glycosyltransferase involved in cell wall biosynthesis
MRIAEVAPPWLSIPPKGYGGIEWVVSLVADGLVERGHDVTLFATGDSRTKAKLDFVFERAPGPKFINDVWHDVMHAVHAYRNPQAFDLYHVHAPWSEMIVPAILGLPTVHTLHGALDSQMRQLFERVRERVWFVAISQAQRAHMPELNYAGVVYNGIDVEAYPFRADKEDFLLFLGRAHPDKGVLRAVLAAKAAGMPLVIAVKVANPDEDRHWNEDVLPMLSPDATVLGEISLAQKLDLLSRARAVLFPIDWDEPFGLVMTEAMACGTPVIATPRGAAPEVVAHGETGFILPVETYVEETREALRTIDRIDPKACRARVQERFSAEAMVSGYVRAFEKVLGSAPGTSSR